MKIIGIALFALLASVAWIGVTPSQDLILQVYSDQKTIAPDENLYLLIEFSNQTDRPIFLPPLTALEISIIVKDESGKVSPAKNGTTQLTGSGYTEIPPFGKAHITKLVGKNYFELKRNSNYSVSASVKITPQTIKTFDKETRKRIREGKEPKGIKAPKTEQIDIALEGSFKSNSVSFGYRPLLGDKVEELKSSYNRHEKFFHELSNRRWGLNSDPKMKKADLLDFMEKEKGFHLCDDTWFQFAISPAWDKTEGEQKSLLEELIEKFPGTTGARRAEAFLAWPEGYLIYSHM